MSISTRLKSFLEENQIRYSVMTHTATYTVLGAAATMQISGKELSKTVVLWAGEELILAANTLATELGKPVRVASEQEFSSLFVDCHAAVGLSLQFACVRR
jgi:hypothetical protein